MIPIKSTDVVRCWFRKGFPDQASFRIDSGTTSEIRTRRGKSFSSLVDRIPQANSAN